MQAESKPQISAIVAMTENRVIGYQNQLPWHLPADLQHFKAITSGHPILMGRKTFESIGRPLPNRTNIILTRDSAYQKPGCKIVASVGDALALATLDHTEIFIIGGAEIYRQFLPFTTRLYITLVHEDFTGDTYFPIIDLSEWKEMKREAHTADEANHYPYSFLLLERETESINHTSR
jgi:dihydrofolate reductase